jgi:hypothetical protein
VLATVEPQINFCSHPKSIQIPENILHPIFSRMLKTPSLYAKFSLRINPNIYFP